MAMLTENVITSGDIGRSCFITPKIPQGLAAAVESLTREVIRQRPKDIYIFAAQHFENLLRQREYCQYDKDDECDDGHECSYNWTAKIVKKYDKSIIKDSSMMTASRRHKYDKRKCRIANTNSTICPKINLRSQTEKNMKIELKKNVIPELNSKIMISPNIDKVKEHVVNKFANVKSLEDLQEINYVTKVQEIVNHSTGRVLNKKLEIFNKSNSVINNNFQAKLNETCNFLENISSCFSPKNNEYYRPYSADSAAHYGKRYVTDKLQVMLSETHDLLVDISNNFLNGSLTGDTGASINGDKIDINMSPTLPAVHSAAISSSSIQSPSLLLSNKNIEDAGATKYFPEVLALPPVIDGTIDMVPIMGRTTKTGQDLILPLLASSSDNRSDRVDQCTKDVNLLRNTREVENDGDTRHITDMSITELDDDQTAQHGVSEDRDDNDNGKKSRLPENIAVLDVKTYNIANTSIGEDLSCNNTQNNMLTTAAIIPLSDNSNNRDPSLDSFGEIVTTSTTATTKPFENMMESLVDDLSSISSMMNRVVKLHQHVDLDCINEEEDVVDEHCQKVKKMVDDKLQDELVERPVELVDWQDVSTGQSNERRDESDRSSSAKETSITDGIILESITNIDHSEVENDGSVSTEMCESSNEAKETTLTDGISLSLDEPMRPFVPELNLDSLQDVTVSSFKMTEDDQYDDNTNSVVETPTSSYHYKRNDAEGSSAEIDEYSFENVEMRQMENKFESNNKSDRGERNTPFGDVSQSGSRCTTRRVNSGNFAWSSKNSTLVGDECGEDIDIMNYDDNVKNNVDCQSCLMVAVTQIQAGGDDFPAQQLHHLAPILNENELRTVNTVMVVDQDVQPNGGKIESPLDAATEIIRSDFRGYHVGKRLCRENAITERTTTMSMEDGGDVIGNCNTMDKYEGFRHTGEFHDCIVLPLYDYHASKIDGEYNGTVMNGINERKITSIDKSRRCLQIPSATAETTSVHNDDVENMMVYDKLYNDMKWFPRHSVFHFGLNKNMTDIAVDRLVLISNNRMILVQDDDRHGKELMSLTSSPPTGGVIIEEITDGTVTPTIIDASIISKENGNPSSSSSSLSLIDSVEKVTGAATITDEGIVDDKKKGDGV